MNAPMTFPGPIGFFDSGVGGFSVMRHAIGRVGGAHLLYVADSAYAPYGERERHAVVERCRLIVRFLLEQGATAIVVACNTATAIAVDTLRSEYSLPIIGMEPGIKPAAALTRSGQIAVLATAGTLRSERYARLLSDHGQRITVHGRICHHWVEAVEHGELDSPRVHDLVHAEIAPLQRAGVDTFVLGCTHFPFLAATIRTVAGDDVRLVDPGPAVVEQLCRRIALPPQPAAVSAVTLFTSGEVADLQRHARELIGLDAPCRPLP